MENGWIKIHRKIEDNIFYKEKRIYSKFEAWFDLILQCNFSESKFLLGYDIYEVEVGSFITSKVKLSKKFGWGKKKLDNFLELLEKQNMVSQKTIGKGNYKATQLFLLKYREYQREGTIDDTTKHPKDDLKTTLSDTQYKKKKNNKKKKNKNIESKDSKELAPIDNRKTEINTLIEELKQQADLLGIAYDKKSERNFGKHIITAKEFGNFCEKIGQERIEFAKNIMIASNKINFWKGTCSGPMSIYQNYSEVYNLTKTKSESSKIMKIETLDGWD